MLLLPGLTRLPFDHPDLNSCALSAGQVCHMYKNVRDTQYYLSYSIIALQTVFLAGLTLIYCFVTDPTIFSPTFSSDIRACSTVLYIIAERWPSAVKVRDSFEKLVEGTVEGQGGRREENRRGLSLMQNNNPSSEQSSNALGTVEHTGTQDSYQQNEIWGILETVLDGDDSWRWAVEGLFNGIESFDGNQWALQESL
jgi:hypothetical protein